MRHGFLSSLAVALAVTQLALAQAVSVPGPKPPPQPPLSASEETTRAVQPGIAKPAPSLSAAERSGPEEQEASEGASPADGACVKDACTSPTEPPWRGDSMEYLLWWVKGSRLPSALPGVFSPGPVQLDTEGHSGGRFTLGSSLDAESQRLGLEGTYLFLGTRTSNVTAVGVNNIAFVRPPVDMLVPLAPLPLPIRSVVESASSRLQGAELNGVGQLWKKDDRAQLDLLAGFRYFEVDEGIALQQRTLAPWADGLDSLSTIAADQFDGHNRFYGGQLGLRGELRTGSCFVNLFGKVALGETYEVVKVTGATVAMGLGGQPQLFPGGVLTSPANSGRVVHGTFAVLPEVGVRAGVDVAERTRLFVGYDFLYLNRAARPADQVNAIAQVRPAGIGVHESDFWTQGLTIGLEFRY